MSQILKTELKELKKKYKGFIETGKQEIGKGIPANLESFIKGKKEAYETIIEDINKLNKKL